MRPGLVFVVAVSLCLLGAVPGMIVTRRQRAKAPGSFHCRLRVQSGTVPGLRHDYRYRRQHCFWVHDVLVIHRGKVFPRPQPLGIRSADGMEGAGDDRVTVVFRLDKGGVVRLLADRLDSSLLAGPFLTAQLEHMTRADS